MLYSKLKKEVESIFPSKEITEEELKEGMEELGYGYKEEISKIVNT